MNHSHLEKARDEIQEARELTDDATARNQFDSLREGLETVDAEDELPDPERGDRLESIERELADIGDEIEEIPRKHAEAARDHLDAFRRESAPDWLADPD